MKNIATIYCGLLKISKTTKGFSLNSLVVTVYILSRYYVSLGIYTQNGHAGNYN